MSSSENLLKDMISGKSMTASQQIGLTVRLSIPAILAQISSIVMQYIDASMVGRLGANASGFVHDMAVWRAMHCGDYRIYCADSPGCGGR